MIDIAPFPVTPTVPFYVNDDAMTAAFQPVTVSTVSNLCAAVVDLTGDPTGPTYAGLNDVDMVFAGSMVKVCALYAAFALRARVQAFVDAAAADGQPVTSPDIVRAIEVAWKPKLSTLFASRPRFAFANRSDISFPKLDEIFTFTADGVVDFTRASPPMTDGDIDQVGENNAPTGMFHEALRLMTRWSNNLAASKCILALGYVYINGLLADGGFFDDASVAGLWLSADYAGHDWVASASDLRSNAAGQALTQRWAAVQRRQRSNITANAVQAARLMTLMAQGTLVDAAASSEMRDLLAGALEGIGSYVKDALEAIARPFTNLAAKKGYGDDEFSHECAIVGRTVGGKAIRYVVVGLGSAPAKGRQDLSDFFVLLDEAVVTRNG